MAGTQDGDVTKSSVTAQVQTLPLSLPTWRTTDTPYKSLGCVPSSETWEMPLKCVGGCIFRFMCTCTGVHIEAKSQPGYCFLEAAQLTQTGSLAKT